MILSILILDTEHCYAVSHLYICADCGYAECFSVILVRVLAFFLFNLINLFLLEMI
jgi:hypothetical protein